MILYKIHGWFPDIPDQRDYLYSAIKPKIKLKPKADLRWYCSTIEKQGRLGSCTACALAGNLEFLVVQESIKHFPIPLRKSLKVVAKGDFLDNMPDHKYYDVSRLFIYYNERALRGNEDYDSGASLRDGIKTLKKTGYCREAIWPYEILRFDIKPSGRCYLEAGRHCIESYYRIHTLTEMLTCLTQGYPFVFGFAVYESFRSKQTEKTGRVVMPEKGERMVGGHAVMAVGYNQKERCFLVRNSWGIKWGRAGYFTMPYEYLETLAVDFWTIRK